MAELANRLEIEDLKENLHEVQALLHRHQLVESLVARQDSPKQDLVEQLVQKQHLAELRAKLDHLHAADVAFILESLPLRSPRARQAQPLTLLPRLLCRRCDREGAHASKGLLHHLIFAGLSEHCERKGAP